MQTFSSTQIIEQQKASTLERVLCAAGVGVMSVGVLMVGYFNPVTAGFFPQCPLYQMTGFACPGCGLTRGFHALLHGDAVTALDYNALIPVYGFILGYLLFSMIFTAIRGRGLSWRIFHPKLMYGFLFVSLAFAVIRNLPIYPFNILYP
ncbi:MAG TPA: DUF2752 domain-containing protein [Pyrinomonadaceae bacterium]|nr:DUF2752 domain-containing protein [Pyrinomonadaceae bacterium]